MAYSNYHNADADKTLGLGGAVRVTIASNRGQGNGGTSLGCVKCLVAADAAITGTIKMNIGAAATSILGINITTSAIDVNIDDVSKLYFWGSDNGDDVDIVYMR